MLLCFATGLVLTGHSCDGVRYVKQEALQMLRYRDTVGRQWRNYKFGTPLQRLQNMLECGWTVMDGVQPLLEPMHPRLKIYP